jgi:hypothetical protein
MKTTRQELREMAKNKNKTNGSKAEKKANSNSTCLNLNCLQAAALHVNFPR